MIRIRECRSEDFEAVLNLLGQLWPDKQLDASSLRLVFDRALVSPAEDYVCAIDEKRVVGFGSLSVKDNLWEAGRLGRIEELVVDVGHRGQGIGTQLLNRLIDLAKERECHRVELDSAFRRKEAHRFYESHWFENRAYLFSKAI